MKAHEMEKEWICFLKYYMANTSRHGRRPIICGMVCNIVQNYVVWLYLFWQKWYHGAYKSLLTIDKMYHNHDTSYISYLKMCTFTIRTKILYIYVSRKNVMVRKCKKKKKYCKYNT